MTDSLKPTEILTPPCRLAFPALFEKKPNHPTTPEKMSFQARIMIPPAVGPKMFAEAIAAACIERWGKVIPLSGRSMPLNACTWKGFEGWFTLPARSQFMPGVVDQAKRPLLALGAEANEDLRRAAEARIFAGVWCRFYIGAWTWDNKAGKGVSFNLNSVQLVREDTPFTGQKSADEVFDALEDADAAPTSMSPVGGAADALAQFGVGQAPNAGAEDALARLLG